MSRIWVTIQIFFTVACNGLTSQEEPDLISEICSKVTNENWRVAAWGNRSSTEVCRETPTTLNEEFIPCTLGARPFFCWKLGDGRVIVYSIVGTFVDEIRPEEMARVAPHLVFIR